MNKETALDIYRMMCESRRFQQILKETDVGGYLDIGEEAINIGALVALDKSDIVGSYFRGEAIPLRYKGFVDMEGHMAWWFRRKGAGNPETNVLPSLWTEPACGFIGPASSCLGGDMDLLCGAALAQKLQRSGKVVIMFVGDGAVAKGNFHEVMTFAALHKLPLIVMIRNNGWAMSTPTSESIAVENIAEMAPAYAMPAEVVDGNDAEAVYNAVQKAAEYAREGKGPYMIEAKTYRMVGHSSHDEDDYRSEKVMEEWKKKDPIMNMEGHLKTLGVTEEEIADICKQAQESVQSAYEKVMTLPPIELGDVRQEHIDVVKRMWGRA